MPLLLAIQRKHTQLNKRVYEGGERTEDKGSWPTMDDMLSPAANTTSIPSRVEVGSETNFANISPVPERYMLRESIVQSVLVSDLRSCGSIVFAARTSTQPCAHTVLDHYFPCIPKIPWCNHERNKKSEEILHIYEMFPVLYKVDTLHLTHWILLYAALPCA